MAASKSRWAVAGTVALVTTLIAGQALAFSATRPVLGPLGGPARWPEIIRLEFAAGVTLTAPGGTLITLRTIGAFGKVGWGDFRLTWSDR